MLRAQLSLVLGGSPDGISPVARSALDSHREHFSASDLLRMLSTLAELEPQFRRSAQQQLLVEILLVRFALFDRALSIEEVLRGLGTDSGRSGGAPPNSARIEARGKALERETRRAATRGDAPTPRKEPVRPAFHAEAEMSAPASSSPPALSPPEGGPGWKVGYEQMANDSGRSRLTTEAVRAERLAALRAQDPVLDAAIEALDLELLD
jgi:hypothetical protein